MSAIWRRWGPLSPTQVADAASEVGDGGRRPNSAQKRLDRRSPTCRRRRRPVGGVSDRPPWSAAADFSRGPSYNWARFYVSPGLRLPRPAPKFRPVITWTAREIRRGAHGGEVAGASPTRRPGRRLADQVADLEKWSATPSGGVGDHQRGRRPGRRPSATWSATEVGDRRRRVPGVADLALRLPERVSGYFSWPHARIPGFRILARQGLGFRILAVQAGFQRARRPFMVSERRRAAPERRKFSYSEPPSLPIPGSTPTPESSHGAKHFLQSVRVAACLGR